MPFKAYISQRFNRKSVDVIEKANTIINEWQARGFDLTLRQLYYQFVARGWMPNSDSEYNKLGNTIRDARMAGLVDWRAIVDRTRNVSHPRWETEGIEGRFNSFSISLKYDHWAGQENRVEIWVEKEALIGIVEQAAQGLDVATFACRGYTSASEMWEAGQRLLRYRVRGQEPVILHLGDHDPSGIDMSRDIEDRLATFMARPPEFKRLALNMDQVRQYDPPPNPAKITDSRANSYIAEYGYESWELDALDPTVITDLIRDSVLEYRDDAILQEILDREIEDSKELEWIYDNKEKVLEFVRDSMEGDLEG